MAKQEQSNTKRYFRGVKAELNKVVWPTKEELSRYTGVVIGMSLLTSLIIFGFDVVIKQILGLLIG